MQIKITERHTEVTEAVRQYVRKKSDKLTRFYNRIQAIEVILDGTKGRSKVEMIARVEGADDFVAHATEPDFLAGVDVVVDKLERQLTKHKEKFRNRKHTARSQNKPV